MSDVPALVRLEDPHFCFDDPYPLQPPSPWKRVFNLFVSGDHDAEAFDQPE